jgi:NAD(P)-dependent dehydrogenase (short-subunit alcohol dehydrogenase family)
VTQDSEASQSAHALQELMGVAGRRALVTGAASGIGLAIARALVACGAKVRGIAILLASRASSFMTGAVYVIDGGALLAYAT